MRSSHRKSFSWRTCMRSVTWGCRPSPPKCPSPTRRPMRNPAEKSSGRPVSPTGAEDPTPDVSPSSFPWNSVSPSSFPWNARPPEDLEPGRSALLAPPRLVRPAPPEDQRAAARRHERREGGQGKVEAPEGDGRRRGAGVLVMARPKDVDLRPARGAAGLPQECPPALPRLEEDDAQLGADEGEDEPRRPVAGAHVDQPAGERVRHRGKDGFHEQGHPIGGRARAGEVHPRAPGGEQVE